jgi:hypothetical protein
MKVGNNLTKRQRHEILRGQLDSEFDSFKVMLRELGDYIMPMRPRWSVSDANKGTRKNQKIINSAATLANRTLMAGMMSGITSPARRWFKLTTPDPDLAEYGPVKAWLHTVEDRMALNFERSNLYNTLPMMYGDLGSFGTAPLSIEESAKNTLICHSFPIGSYRIAKDFDGKVNVFFRQFRMTVRQIIATFGKQNGKGEPDWSVFSTFVRAAYERGQYETWVDVCHVVKPNDEHDEYALTSKYKKFESCYYESGFGSTQTTNYLQPGYDSYLKESGFDIFPILCPRWFVNGEDVYATDCPGMTALGDIKSLQTYEKRKAQAIEKMVNPPMVGHTSLKNQRASLLPGDVTYADDPKYFQPAFKMEFRLAEASEEIAKIERRIERCFYADLFLLLANADREGITATEVAERKEEKLLALGPVLEQLNQDLLDPLIENTFFYMDRQGQIPTPPDELRGGDVRVEYISMMAQAQKALGLSGMDRFMTRIEGMAEVMPQSLSKVNTDKFVEIYGESCGISPTIIRTDEEAQALRDQAAKAAQAQAQAEQMKNVASSAKDLSQSDTEGENALTALINQGKAGSLVG